MSRAVDGLHEAGRPGYGVWATAILVETLLQRGTESDLAKAQTEFDRLASLRKDQDEAILDITLLRLRTLLSQARGDDISHRDLVIRYRTMAESLGFEGHIAWAKAMSESLR